MNVTQEGVIVTVRVVPRSSKNECEGLLGDMLKVRLRSPPVDGKGNIALAKFLATKLGIRVSQIVLLSGAGGRTKRLFIRGIDPQRVEKLAG